MDVAFRRFVIGSRPRYKNKNKDISYMGAEDLHRRDNEPHSHAEYDRRQETERGLHAKGEDDDVEKTARGGGADDLHARHLKRLARRAARLANRSRAFSWARLATVVAGAVVVYWLFRSVGPNAGVASLVGGIAVFIGLVKMHDRVEESLSQTRLLRRIKELHEHRRALNWSEIPEEPDDIDLRMHPLAADLNIIGPRSLHHLVDACASKGARDVLREWLMDPVPEYERIMRRQALVLQLVPLGIFRDHLARMSMLEGLNRHWDDGRLRDWLLREDVAPQLRSWLVGLSAFAFVNVLLIIGHIAGLVPMLWPMTVLVYFAIYFMKYRSVKDLFDEAQDLDLMLERFTPPLEYLERFRFAEGSEAERVRAPLRQARPSRELRSLRRIAAASAVTRSEFLWLLLNVILPWQMLFTVLMHRAKDGLRAYLPTWLDAWYRIEAASSLAAYAESHSQRVFPNLEEPADGVVFEGEGLGHPLLREDVKVRNDFRVDRLGQVVLITGSNMSGKSTFLRTIGVNLRMAYAGGPVDAVALRTTCFRVFTSINVVDSVQEGLSHFYAEVQRLKQLLDALNDGTDLPLFNLIDEIFRGTNNRERLIGSRAFIRALAGRRAISLISTHDLELTQLEEEVSQLSNFHFREDVSGDRMTFDYTLRTGPCPTTNALKIMARAGLPVGEEGEGEGEINRKAEPPSDPQ